MRKLFFYLFILKKLFLLLIYPVFNHSGGFLVTVRKNIENFLIFQPSRLRAKRIHRNLLKKITPLRFVNNEGIKLYAWYSKPKGKKPVIMHFHGQAESILSHQDIAEFCLKNGYGLFMLSYRGHYKSGGKASEKGIYEDAKAGMRQLKNLGVDEDKIILWGHSLGSAVAIETARHYKVAGVILQCPIKEIKSAAVDVFNFYCDRLRINFLTKFAIAHIKKMDFIQKVDNINKIQDVNCPILLLHSKTDKIASFINSVELSEKNSKSTLFISEKGSHWDADWCLDEALCFIKNIDLVPKI